MRYDKNIIVLAELRAEGNYPGTRVIFPAIVCIVHMCMSFRLPHSCTHRLHLTQGNRGFAMFPIGKKMAASVAPSEWKRIPGAVERGVGTLILMQMALLAAYAGFFLFVYEFMTTHISPFSSPLFPVHISLFRHRIFELQVSPIHLSSVGSSDLHKESSSNQRYLERG